VHAGERSGRAQAGRGGLRGAAAVCDGALNALACLRRASWAEAGQKILVCGASGSAGTAAVQLARCFGADVTAVCNTKNLELGRSLGAGQVIDCTAEDFTSSGQAYDVICDAVGKHLFGRCKGSLKRGGIYLAADGWLNLALALRPARAGSKKVMLAIPPRYARQDILFLKQLIEAGKYRAVIDRRYPLEQVVRTKRPAMSRPSRRPATSS
jgi:NADPH:quinone reductase-like Zn-dependent oxidoreductase